MYINGFRQPKFPVWTAMLPTWGQSTFQPGCYGLQSPSVPFRWQSQEMATSITHSGISATAGFGKSWLVPA